MSQELREQTLELAVRAAGDKGADRWDVLRNAEEFYQYVTRTGEFAKQDARKALLWNATKAWRDIVARIGPASDEQRAAVLEILKDVEPWLPPEETP